MVVVGVVIQETRPIPEIMAVAANHNPSAAAHGPDPILNSHLSASAEHRSVHPTKNNNLRRANHPSTASNSATSTTPASRYKPPPNESFVAVVDT